MTETESVEMDVIQTVRSKDVEIQGEILEKGVMTVTPPQETDAVLLVKYKMVGFVQLLEHVSWEFVETALLLALNNVMMEIPFQVMVVAQPVKMRSVAMGY